MGQCPCVSRLTERPDESGLAARGGVLSAALLLTLGVYATIGSHGWIYDDPAWRAQMTASVRPLANLTLWSFNLQTAIGAGVGALHWGNLAVHLMNGSLVYALARRIGGSLVGLLAASVFLLHPIQREAVNYLSGRADLLSTTLILLAVLGALSRPRWYLPALGCCALAVLTKPSAIVAAPLCLLTLAIYQNREREVKALAWLGIGLSAVLFTIFAPIAAATFLQPPLIDLLAYAGHQAVAVWRLLALVILPSGFSIDHDYAWVTLSTGLLALVALGGAGRWLWGNRRAYPMLAWAGLWIVVAVAPRFVALGAYPMGPEITEPQFYPAMAGVSIGAAALLKGWL